MARLIKKNEAIVIIEREKEIDTSTEWGDGFLSGLNAIEENLALLETVTEEEIRSKAYDRFMKEIEAEYDNDACPNVSDYLDYKISLRDLFRIAEKLKEE